MKIPATWTQDVITTTTSSSAPTTTSALTSKSRTTAVNKPQQCLRFAPTIEVAEIPNRDAYSAEELEATWFQGYDYDEFRENSYMTMGLYRAGLLVEGVHHTMRGLEGRLLQTAREREQTRRHASAAVLNEQYRQYRLGYSNTQAIADLYHAVSWKSQYNAYTLAMVDEQEQQRHKLALSFSPRRSDAKNLLRKVIDIERVDECMDSATFNTTTSCAFTATNDFDINSFFQELTIAAQ